MLNENLLISVDNSNSGYHMNPSNVNRWSFVYAHGKLERDYMFDIVLFNKEMPTNDGYFIATADNNQTVLVNLVVSEDGRIEGRCCYVDDYESLKHINSPQDWA